MKLLGKKALITGAARGIGRACAQELAQAGADVAINDLDRSEMIESAATEIRALGHQVSVVEGDVFARPSCERVVARALEALGQIDIFVSNPALNRRAPFLECEPDVFEQNLQGTLTGGFHMSQLVARHMVERGGRGKIIFISSVHARVPYARATAYNAGKSGLNSLAFSIAHELLPHRINVNVIEPGWIDTPGEHESFGDEAIRNRGPQLPWGRLGQPHEIGKAVVFLASDDADYITGTSLLIDGGLWLRGAMQ